MITYSRQDIEDRLRTDQALWRRLGPAIGDLVWPLAVVLLGWDAGWRLGAAVVILLSAVSVLLPGRLRVSIYILDLLESGSRLPTGISWLVLAWYLWQREALFPLFGQPVLGAVAIACCLWALNRVTSFVIRLCLRPLAFRTAK